MKVPNVHEGDSNKGNYNSRGSQGCITLNPEFSDRILDHFVGMVIQAIQPEV